MAITVAAVVEPATAELPPRVKLTVTRSASESSATITRQDPDGQIVPVRTATGDPLALSSTTTTLYDYEAPFGVTVWYSSLETPANTVGVVVDEARIWFIHPGVPVLSMPVTVREWGSRSRPVVQGVYRPMGRRTAVVHTDGQRKSAEYTLTLLTQTLPEGNDLEALVEDSGTLLLNVPPSFNAGWPTEYVAVGDLTEDRLARLTSLEFRAWTLPCTVVARPEGGSQATRTWTDVLIEAGSWAEVKTNFSTWLQVVAGR